MQLFYLKNYLYCPAKDIKAFRPPFLERAAGSRGRALVAPRRERNPQQSEAQEWEKKQSGGRTECVHDCTM